MSRPIGSPTSSPRCCRGPSAGAPTRRKLTARACGMRFEGGSSERTLVRRVTRERAMTHTDQTHRPQAWRALAAAAAFAAASALTATPAAALTDPAVVAKGYKAPRDAWGHPDLAGVWSPATI